MRALVCLLRIEMVCGEYWQSPRLVYVITDITYFGERT